MVRSVVLLETFLHPLPHNHIHATSPRKRHIKTKTFILQFEIPRSVHTYLPALCNMMLPLCGSMPVPAASSPKCTAKNTFDVKWLRPHLPASCPQQPVKNGTPKTIRCRLLDVRASWSPEATLCGRVFPLSTLCWLQASFGDMQENHALRSTVDFATQSL